MIFNKSKNKICVTLKNKIAEVVGEKEPEYCKIARARIKAVQKPLLWKTYDKPTIRNSRPYRRLVIRSNLCGAYDCGVVPANNGFMDCGRDIYNNVDFY